jgi:hypothetical protein
MALTQGPSHSTPDPAVLNVATEYAEIAEKMTVIFRAFRVFRGYLPASSLSKRHSERSR